MNQFKKVLLALAVAISLGFIAASNANAQVNCTAFSVPTLVRSQGLTELVGNISLTCPAGSVLGATVNVSLTIQPPTAVVTNDTAAPPIATVTGAAVPGAITWSGNTVNIPVGAGAITGLTISNIRVNAAASGVVFPAQISALLTSSPATQLAITNNQLNVAIPQSAITIAFSSGAGIPQCSSATFAGAADAPANLTIDATATKGTLGGIFAVTAGSTIAGKAILSSSGATPGTTAKVTVTEGFSAAFHTKADEGAAATQGTRFVINLAGLPSNLVIYAPESVSMNIPGGVGLLVVKLVSSAGADGSGGTISAGTATTADLIQSTSITYEVTTDDDANANGVIIPFQFFTAGTPSPTGAIAVTAALAPTSLITTYSTGSPIPRFTAASPAAGTATSVIPCVTNIFFPFVSNQLGFDTGFALANTTSDPFGTSSQSGTCVYNFYGQNPPSGGTFTTGSIAGGATDVQVLSSIAKNFQGYVIAQCNFQLGHGFNFIISGPLGAAGTVGMGGPGLIILQPGTTSSSTRKGLAAVGPPFGEALNN